MASCCAVCTQQVSTVRILWILSKCKWLCSGTPKMHVLFQRCGVLSSSVFKHDLSQISTLSRAHRLLWSSWVHTFAHQNMLIINVLILEPLKLSSKKSKRSRRANGMARNRATVIIMIKASALKHHRAVHFRHNVWTQATCHVQEHGLCKLKAFERSFKEERSSLKSSSFYISFLNSLREFKTHTAYSMLQRKTFLPLQSCVQTMSGELEKSLAMAKYIN